MSNSPTWLRVRWPLALALLASLLVHAWMIGALDGWLSEDDAPARTLIRVTLVNPPAPKPVTPPPGPPAQAGKKVERPKLAKAVPPAPPEPLPAPAIGASQPVTVPVPVEPAVAAEPAAPVALPLPVEEVPPPQAVEESPPSTPRHVEIDFQVVRKGGVAAIERHRYEVAEDGAYVLTSLAEPKGLLSLALSDLNQRSEGQVTAHGLRPASYLYQYGKNADKAQKASFDWQGKKLVMEQRGRRQEVELQEGAQDLMSFMYQFMFVPPLQDTQIAVTNGKNFRVYNYAFEGEEALTIKAGTLRTWRIGKSNGDGEEKTELWLAADHFYLPVKISKTEKDGTVTERIATRLQTE